MANRTAWTAGNGVGYTWTSIFTGGGDQTAATTLANGSSILSSSTITNQTAQDIFCDLSIQATIASSTTVAGANISGWMFYLLADGSTLGDGILTAGTAAAHVPAFSPDAMLPLFVGTTQTVLNGIIRGIVMAPGSFAWVINNGSGFAFTACTIKYRTYNTNLNN